MNHKNWINAREKRVFTGRFLIGLFVLFFFYSCEENKQAPLRVAVASNAQFVADSLKTVFEQQYPVQVELIVTSSGKLTAQIKHGAPYDVFLSADMKYPRSLDKANAALTRPKVYAHGKLVLWTTQNISLENGLASLTNPEIRSIAIANPKTAPYGVAAISALKQAGIYNDIKDKLVYGESISQVNQYQLSGATNVAFTAMSIVKDPELRNKGTFKEINDSLYQPIQQGVIILKQAKENNLEAAEAFFQFLFSEKAQAIFRFFGYNVDVKNEVSRTKKE